MCSCCDLGDSRSQVIAPFSDEASYLSLAFTGKVCAGTKLQMPFLGGREDVFSHVFFFSPSSILKKKKKKKKKKKSYNQTVYSQAIEFVLAENFLKLMETAVPVVAQW